MTKKKITKVEASKDVKMPQSDKKFVPSEENKKKSTTNRFIAIILWAISIGLEIYAITLLNKAGGSKYNGISRTHCGDGHLSDFRFFTMEEIKST